MIRKCKEHPRCWVLCSTKGKTLGIHTSEAGAKRQERAINISKARKAGHRIPRKKAKR